MRIGFLVGRVPDGPAHVFAAGDSTIVVGSLFTLDDNYSCFSGQLMMEVGTPSRQMHPDLWVPYGSRRSSLRRDQNPSSLVPASSAPRSFTGRGVLRSEVTA